MARRAHGPYDVPSQSGWSELVPIPASGAALTVDARRAPTWDATLTANCTLALTGAPIGRETGLTLILRQDATGSRTATWPASVTWLSGAVPVLHTAANAVDTVVLYTVNGGTTWYGAQVAPPGLAFGSATITANTLTTSTSFVDVTGSAVTLTSGPHRLKITWVGLLTVGIANDWVQASINLDGTDVDSGAALVTAGPLASGSETPFTIVYVTSALSAGSHTIKGRTRRNAGTGGDGIAAGSSTPSLLYVEELPY